jgi:hypothetical protein
MTDFYEDKIIIGRMKECLQNWRKGRKVFDLTPYNPDNPLHRPGYDQSKATFLHYAKCVLIEEGEFPGLSEDQFARCFEYVCAGDD